ncbi:hypothetical protein BDW22DRAFT_1482667 [Trametopsis cervina]|nr:hypothetical protein BDW22DRAFT_1482667 [Trametopsis cervina]
MVKPTTAPHPFDGHDYDFVLRSLDSKEFRVKKRILSRISREFKSLVDFVSKRDDDEEENPAFVSQIAPKVDVPFSSTILYSILISSYPTVDNLDDIMENLEASGCYAVRPQLGSALRHALPDFMVDEPERIFVIACQFGFEREAYLAAHVARRVPRPHTSNVDDPLAEANHISAGMYFRFQQFRVGLLDDLRTPVYTPATQNLTFYAPSFDVGDPPDLRVVTTEGIEFECYKRDMIHASSHLKDLVRELPKQSVLRLDEDCVEASRLLDLLYHRGHPDIFGLEDIKAFMAVVDRYEIRGAEDYLRVQCLRVPEATSDPLRVYFVALDYGWYEEARKAARVLVKKGHRALSSMYAPEMEEAPAMAYDRLLNYSRVYQCAVHNINAEYHTHSPAVKRARKDYLAQRTARKEKENTYNTNFDPEPDATEQVNVSFLRMYRTFDAKIAKGAVSRLLFTSARAIEEAEEALSNIRLELEDIEPHWSSRNPVDKFSFYRETDEDRDWIHEEVKALLAVCDVSDDEYTPTETDISDDNDDQYYADARMGC